MRQKAGPGLPLHLPILYRKRNSNLSQYASFALPSGLKGFVHGNFGQILDHSRALTFLGAPMIGLTRVDVAGQCGCCPWPEGSARLLRKFVGCCFRANSPDAKVPALHQGCCAPANLPCSLHQTGDKRHDGVSLGGQLFCRR